MRGVIDGRVRPVAGTGWWFSAGRRKCGGPLGTCRERPVRGGERDLLLPVGRAGRCTWSAVSLDFSCCRVERRVRIPCSFLTYVSPVAPLVYALGTKGREPCCVESPSPSVSAGLKRTAVRGRKEPGSAECIGPGKEHPGQMAGKRLGRTGARVEVLTSTRRGHSTWNGVDPGTRLWV